MSNVLSTTKQQQVVALGRLGWSTRRIQRETGVRRETVGKYLKEAGVEVASPGWGGSGRGRDVELDAERDVSEVKSGHEVITDPEASEVKSGHEVITDPEASEANSGHKVITDSGPRSACAAHDGLIREWLSAGRTAMSMYQELVDEHGFGARYASVQRYVRKLRAGDREQRFAVITTAPGEEAQVDYGTGPRVRDASGSYRQTRLFVLTLGNSRRSIRLLTFKSSTTQWCQLHIDAFARLGGTPKVVVLDNLREGVIKADVYDPELNPVYRDMLTHYGVTALPCRVRDPNRKGKVESAVRHTQNAYRGKRFESLEDAQRWLDAWDKNWADTRIHGTTKRQVQAMFAEEKPHLQPLPTSPFRMYEHGIRSVHLNGCVEVASAFYSAPPGLVGRKLPVQWDAQHVRLLDPDTHQLLREHLRIKPGSYRVRPEDRPKHQQPGVTQLLSRATAAGEHIGKVASAMHGHAPISGIRGIQGLLALTKKYGRAAVDEAAEAALECGAANYRFIKRYLERTPQSHDVLKNIDPIIRQLNTYRDLVEERANKTGLQPSLFPQENT